MASAIAAPRRDAEVRAPDRTQHLVMIDDPVADDVDDLAFFLQLAPHRDHRGRHHLPPVDLELARPEDALRHTGFVLDGDKQHALRRSWTLPHEDDTGDLDIASITDGAKISATHYVHVIEL